MPTSLPVLTPAMPACRDCALGSGCSHPGIPTRRFGSGPKKERAIFFVGEAPGRKEDEEGVCFVGSSGAILEKLYIHDALDFDALADVYIGNAVRCRPEDNETPVDKHVRACGQFLTRDLRALADVYKEVHVVCCGATAVKAVLGLASLKEGLKQQGCGWPPPPKVSRAQKQVDGLFAAKKPRRKKGDASAPSC